jgi:glycerophosphoryl diester phosphodiesterase
MSVYQELENTRKGFQKCANMGADAVELDIFLLKCGTLIEFHGAGNDANPGQLLEYCGMKGSILDLTYEEALQLTFNPSYAEFPCPDNSTLAGTIAITYKVALSIQPSCWICFKIKWDVRRRIERFLNGETASKRRRRGLPPRRYSHQSSPKR